MTDAAAINKEFVRVGDRLVQHGSVVVKMVGDCGPYGYLVTWNAQTQKQEWKYLGRAEPGLSEGIYKPGVPLRFDKRKESNFVGNWDSFKIESDLEKRLELGDDR